MMRQRGFTLIEALVALLILSLGMMGIAAMQLNALHSATRSYQHSVATLAAVDAQERLWEQLGKELEDDDSDNNCKNLDGKIESDWKDYWQRNKSSNPLRNANAVDIDAEGCVYTITVTLDDAGEDDEGYSTVTYRVRLPEKQGNVP